jgi:predicted Zn-dependent protease
MDIHQAGTREDRYYYAWAQQDSDAWHVLDRKYRFDEVMLFTEQHANDHLLDYLGADTTRWALVFSDDAASLFLRRDGRYAKLADDSRYRVLPAGRAAWYPRLAAAISDSAARRELEAEFRRAADASGTNARALIGLSLLADAAGREQDAMALLDRAVSANPFAESAHRYRAELQLGRGNTHAALADLARELAIHGPGAELDTDFGRAYQQAGNIARARTMYRRAVQRGGDVAAARDSLARLEGAAGR